MDSMEWFLGSVAVLTAVLLVGLDTGRSLQRYRVRLGRLLKALRDAAENGAGLLEATDVVEVEPLDLKKTTSYSDLNQCDPEGAFIYQKVARAQISEFMKSKKS